MHMRKAFPPLTILLLCLAVSASAGDLAREIAEIDDGYIHFHFESREGVRGDCANIMTGEQGIRYRSGRHHDTDDRDHDDDRDRFDEGPLHVLLRLRSGEVENVKVCVGETPRFQASRCRDLGELPAAEASSVLLGLVEREQGPDVEDCILPAILARGFDAWDRLIDIARNRRIDDDIREQCVFWLGQGAADEATRGLGGIIEDDGEDLDLREHAIFALSQQESEETFPLLQRIALNNEHARLRRSALFWLAQLDDERALDLFEEILLN